MSVQPRSTAGSPPTTWSATSWLKRHRGRETASESSRARCVKRWELGGGRGQRNAGEDVWAQVLGMHCVHSDVCVWGGRACVRQAVRLSAAGCGSQLSGGAQRRGQRRPGESRASGRQGLEPGLAHSKWMVTRAREPLIHWSKHP